MKTEKILVYTPKSFWHAFISVWTFMFIGFWAMLSIIIIILSLPSDSYFSITAAQVKGMTLFLSCACTIGAAISAFLVGTKEVEVIKHANTVLEKLGSKTL